MLSRYALFAAIILIAGTTVAEEAAAPTIEDRLSAVAAEHRMRLDFVDEVFSGPAWERLVAEGSAAQFFLIGEEHGIAENPKLVTQLFSALADDGYTKLAIEVSPTMAQLLDEALVVGGLDGLRDLYSQPGGEPAFYGMAEEGQMLAAVRAAAHDGAAVLWGTDYEVAGDRQLLKLLQAAGKPAAAQAALDAVAAASAAAWAKYEETRGPQFIYSFSGDPALVRAVREAWPEPDPQSAVILHTLEETLSINNLWMQGRAWESNERRAALMRGNFLRYWSGAKRRGEAPKVMAKFGASHLVRGQSMTEVFDLGTLLPEIAALEGSRSFSVMVVPGSGSSIAALNPSAWSYEPQPAEGGYIDSIGPITVAAFEDAFTLIDLTALRPVVGMDLGKVDKELFRIIHGYDMLLVMSGSTASGELDHD